MRAKNDKSFEYYTFYREWGAGAVRRYSDKPLFREPRARAESRSHVSVSRQN